MLRPSKQTTALLLAFLLSPANAWCIAQPIEQPASEVHSSLGSLFGAWKATGDPRILHIEADRIVTYQKGKQTVQGILGYEANTLIVRDQGLRNRWKVALEGTRLRITTPEGSYEFNRLAVVPPEVVLQPFKLGAPVELPPERIRAIQMNLRERLTKDQEALKSGGLTDGVLSDNLTFLKELVREVGWIDVARFGRQASADAILIAKHGNELDLMVAILPYVEKDFKESGDDAQMFTILYDGLQLDLGRKQRYGTQIGVDARGEPMVLPLEDPSRTDEHRKELGLPPLSEYLETAAKALFKGKQIRLPRPEE